MDMRSSHARARQFGQGMTEYIIIVAVVAIAAIAVFEFFGQSIRNQAAGIVTEISGQSASKEIQGAQAAAQGADQDAAKSKGLSTYDSNGGQNPGN
jgi:Flp pilus assembly pilin Flp